MLATLSNLGHFKVVLRSRLIAEMVPGFDAWGLGRRGVKMTKNILRKAVSSAPWRSQNIHLSLRSSDTMSGVSSPMVVRVVIRSSLTMEIGSYWACKCFCLKMS